ncbi:MAG: hypothetical protein AAFN74_01655 [Myxococcota bacterium]
MRFVSKLTGFLSDLSRAELRRVLPVACAYGLILASLYLLKPARNALFLSQIGIDQLPYVLLLVALVGSVTALVYGRFARAMRTDQLIRITFVTFMVMLIGFRALLPTGWPWVYYVFFIWVALYGVLTTSLIWLLANAIFTSREARRVFGFIGAGGIAGAIFGGVFTGWAVDILGTENLLIVCVLFVAGSLGLLKLTPAAGEAAEDRPSRRRTASTEGVGLKEVLSTDLIRTLALTTGLIAAVAVIVDIQFNEMVHRHFADQDAKTAFFGQFFAALSAISFLIQLFATPLLLRTAGVGVSIMILPVAMGLGSVAMLLAPGLLAAIVAKGADGGFRHSIHKAASEVIFLPVPSATKKTAKLFLDTTIDASATGLGALLVVALTGPFGLDITQVSFVAVGLITLTIAIAPRMRRAYVDAFRAALERRSLDMSALTTHLSEAAVVNGLLRALSGDNPRQVLYALDLLTSAKSPGIVEAVRPLLAHPSAEVRFRALEVLLAQKSTLPPDALTPLLQDESEAVRRAAMQALSAQEGTDRRAFLQQQLDGDDDLRRAAALGCIALRPAGVAEPLLTADRTASLLAQAEMPESLRAQLLAAIAVHPNPNIAPDVLNALPHESSVIQKTVIEAMGRSRQARHISFLVDRLNDRKLRRECRRNLARFGDIIVPHVLNELDNGARTPQQREALVRVLEDVGTQAASDALLAHLTSPFPAQYRAVVRSLSRIRHTQPDLVFTKDTVHRAVLADVEWYYDLTRLAASVGEGSTASDRLLGRALEEKRRLTLENIFSLLGLRHPPRDLAVAYQGIQSPKKPVRASALEFLENVLQPRFKTVVLPMLEPPAQGLVAAAEQLYPKDIATRPKALTYLLRRNDPWLKACAIHCVRPDDSAPLPDLVAAARNDADAIVRETAEAAMGGRRGADGHR